MLLYVRLMFGHAAYRATKQCTILGNIFIAMNTELCEERRIII